MAAVCAELGIHKVVFTTPYRPEGHGKVEALNRLIRAAFIAEIKASAITTLDDLNRAFVAWAEQSYNRRVHSELGVTPRERWQAGLAHVRHVDEARLRKAFQWTETRKTDKTGTFSLFGLRYQCGAELARRRVTVRYDAEALDIVEVWLDDRFVERVRPLQIAEHRRAKTVEQADDSPPAAPVVDWLGHLVAQDDASWQDPEAELRRLLDESLQQTEQIVSHVESRLHPDVFDRRAVLDWLERFGPLDPEPVGEMLDFVVEHLGPEQHIGEYLDALHAALLGGGQ
jgi:hypothetical protein